ncbi:MAG: tryptophan synthase subunit alpha [Gammaproteobacteria bacterium]
MSGAPMGAAAIEEAIRRANAENRPAVVAFMTAGFPTKEAFTTMLGSLCQAADVVEIGVPFTDPMADGLTIQRSSHTALENGVTLDWILTTIAAGSWDAPIILMGYLNPMLAMGYDTLAQRAQDSGVAGFIVPDLPFEESAPMREPLAARGLALVQLVTPLTPLERLEQLCRASGGFVYAVTVTGITGGAQAGAPTGDAAPDIESVGAYLDRVRSVSEIPVCAGFGIRGPEQVKGLSAHADGVVVGSRLIELVEAGEDPVAFVKTLHVQR